MRSTLSRSLAAVAAGAALTLVPVGVALADDHILEPDEIIAFDPKLNQADAWEDWILEEFEIIATCTKDDDIDDPYEIPAFPSEDEAWFLAVLKGGSGEEANELYYEPMPGDLISHSEAGNSHVILCSAEVEEETTTTTTTTPVTSTTTTATSTTTTTTPSTGPVVETDIPSDGGPSQLGLFAGLAAALAAAGGFVLNRRRQSAEH